MRWLPAPLLATVAVIVGGCGSDGATDPETGSQRSGPPYEETILSVHADMNDAMSTAFQSGELDSELVREAKQTAQEATSALKATEPPADYEDAHAEYVQGLETFVDILGDVEAHVDDPDVARRHLGDKRFTTGVQHLERASQLYDRAGLDLDQPSEPG